MPLWQIYHPVDTYSDQDKQDFADTVTAFYTRVGLPDFYVVVLFHEVPTSSFFVGGKPSAGSVRVVVDHLARQAVGAEMRKRMTERVADLIRPYTADRGLYWEFNITESERDLWMIDGLWPPDQGSAAEQLWAEEHRPLPY
ncbi:4-oxalocrotonate tautomerase [Nocardia panacis]|uniref:4-oxalocrotonate tautomerase n=1 Tax=Nocardia panacis TaxID=2340916 RepID=A0A3A4KYF7_9NOCA|nr:tautomerase family protein [Nocardia panacis]RJO78845.1 4-oxalocrotonate tautomerase [Nocardia panacis]